MERMKDMPDNLDALINACLDGRLSEPQRAKLEARLGKVPLARRLERLRRLRAQLAASAPQPSAEQSRRMWEGVRSRLAAQQPVETPILNLAPQPGPWTAFLLRPWLPKAGLGLLGAAVALALVLLAFPRTRPDLVPAFAPAPAAAVPAAAAAPAPAPAPVSAAQSLPDQASQARSAVASSAPAAASALSREASPAPSAGLAAARRPAAPAVSQPSTGTTEVERALADNHVDDMIDQFLTARQAGAGPVAAVAGPGVQAAPSPAGQGDAATVGYDQATVAVPDQPRSEPGKPTVATGSKDHNGFWDWKPAAQALNQRDWNQARAELEAASGKAGAASERAFADSALTLLAAPGAPLEGSQPLLPAVGDLRVLAAGSWQLLVDSRLARFNHGVSVRMPGFRADGDSLLLDLTFDRGEFAPGAHFVRVSGETPAHVVDAAGQPVSSDDFYAPSGADYNIPDRELRLR